MSSIISRDQFNSNASLKHLSDNDLVAQARVGNEQALTELWSRHGERTHRVVSRIIRNREDAKDILQETYMKVFLHLASFNGESQFSTWLTRIAINSAFMLLRRHRSHQEHFIDSSEPDCSDPVMNLPDRSESIEARLFHSERLQQLRLAVQRLPHSLRYIVELQNHDELTLLEIAQRTGLSVPAVKARLVRARATLRKFTSQECLRTGSQRRGRRLKESDHPLRVAS
jgi:RNA polymerase sigma factor (sigma-70 family)